MENKRYNQTTTSIPIKEQERHNRELSATLNNLINKAKQNQITQEKFYQLELHLLQSTSLTGLFEKLLVELSQKLDLEIVELHLIDSNDEIQRLIHDIYGDLDYENLSYHKSESTLNEIYQGNQDILLSQDQELINQLFSFSSKKAYSVALLPLIRENTLIGSIHFGSHNKQRFVPGLATSFLQHFGSIISICIENAVTQEQFKLLSLVDLLTRTKNRRYFIQSLTKEIARSSRSESPISCLFMDLDHFKEVNDSHGHLTGDRALQSVATTIMPLLRKSDVFARFGGEEFTILLPDTSQKQALEIAERIRQEISQISIANDLNQAFKITVSIGVSTWSANKASMTYEQVQNYLISQADKGVYLAKDKGRNCVAVAPETLKISNC
ncbi:MAG: sensor domain-containing diguanylate cyclase [Kangiellaceae bacterium]|nr:sensor domain-containing diguanylate cyclase [Kangiellaceae bacterium]